MVNKVTSPLREDETPDAFDRYLSVLRQIAKKGIEWNARPLSTSAFRAIAVMQSENIKDPQAALRTLDEATALIGESQVLTDQKARVYFYSNQYEEALVIWDNLLPHWEKATTFDRPFSIRWAGMAA